MSFINSPEYRANGASGFRNILLVHFICNRQKGDRDPRPCELIYLEAAHMVFDALDKRGNRDIAALAVS